MPPVFVVVRIFQGNMNDWMCRLVYGILSLVLGAMALLLPETRKATLPRTMLQVERLPTSVSVNFRRHRTAYAKKHPDRSAFVMGESANFNDTASVRSGLRSMRPGPSDHQSTLHSVYELHEIGHDEPGSFLCHRYPSRRGSDVRNSILSQSFSTVNNEINRGQQPIAEDVEYDTDIDDERRSVDLQEQQPFSESNRTSQETGKALIIVPVGIEVLSTSKNSSSDVPWQVEVAGQDQRGEQSALTDSSDQTRDNLQQDDDSCLSPKYSRGMSQENFFSENS